MYVSQRFACPRVNLYLSPVEPLPEINLDPFEICIFAMWLPGETLYYSLMMFFGTSLNPPQLPFLNLTRPIPDVTPYRDATESLSFAIIVFAVWRSRMIGHSSVPSILDSILQDATLYFLFIFSAHLVSLLFLFVTPVCISVVVDHIVLTTCMCSGKRPTHARDVSPLYFQASKRHPGKRN